MVACRRSVLASNVICLLLDLVLAVEYSRATTYYVSSLGNDRASGTSPSQAWATVGRVNQVRFLPGDAVLFHGGDVFYSANLYLSQNDSGTPERPIRIR